MKIKIILIIMITQFTISCRTIHYSPIQQLLPYSFDMINNPDKIGDMKKFYPEIYETEYIRNNLQDSIYLNNIINYILNVYSKYPQSIDVNCFWVYDDFFDISKNGERIFVTLTKGKVSIFFTFICVNNKFYINDIGVPDNNPS